MLYRPDWPCRSILPAGRHLFASLWLRVLMLLTAAALALHAWVGMRDVFMDYVHIRWVCGWRSIWR
jgi:succinate dehydrogenase hydrophobic membrane anchor protein